MSKIPSPGSEEAVDAGCTCPVLDNNHGRGARIGPSGPLFWRAESCPLHGFGGGP